MTSAGSDASKEQNIGHLFKRGAKVITGNTPLARIQNIAYHSQHAIWGKCEFMNPTGSVKDRAAFAMIEAAERSGRIVPGRSILVEATAGNTGASLAAAAANNYPIKLVLMDKFGLDKVSLVRAWGAEVIICPSNVSREHPDFWLNKAKFLGEQNEHHFYVDQFNNPANPEVHYRTTGPEIWHQTDGKVDAVVAGFGTGGTLMGVARFLKEQRRSIRIIVADPVGSVLRCPPRAVTPKPYLVEGIGSPFLPNFFDRDLVDEVISVPDSRSFETCLRLARDEGLFVGGSSGCAVAATLDYIEHLGGVSQNIVVILPDGGDRYLSTIYSKQWRTEKLLGKMEYFKERNE